MSQTRTPESDFNLQQIDAEFEAEAQDLELTVLSFDPGRATEPALDRPYDDAALALALGLTEKELEADEDLYAHAHYVYDIETAYQKSAAEGRTALMAALLTQYSDAYDSGLDDGKMTAARG